MTAPPPAEHACPWPGCGRAIRRERFMCTRHFPQLPIEHRIAVNVAWQQGDTLALIAAQDAALDWVEGRDRSCGA